MESRAIAQPVLAVTGFVRAGLLLPVTYMYGVMGTNPARFF